MTPLKYTYQPLRLNMENGEFRHITAPLIFQYSLLLTYKCTGIGDTLKEKRKKRLYKGLFRRSFTAFIQDASIISS